MRPGRQREASKPTTVEPGCRLPADAGGDRDVPTCSTGPIGRLAFVWRELAGAVRGRGPAGRGKDRR